MVELDLAFAEVSLSKPLALTAAFGLGWLFGLLCAGGSVLKRRAAERKSRQDAKGNRPRRDLRSAMPPDFLVSMAGGLILAAALGLLVCALWAIRGGDCTGGSGSMRSNFRGARRRP